MGKKKLITLATELDFQTEHEYFDYIIDSEINGQRSQVRSLIGDMKKDDQKDFLDYCELYATDEQKRYFLDIIL